MGHPITDPKEIAVDHITPVAMGGAP